MVEIYGVDKFMVEKFLLALGLKSPGLKCLLTSYKALKYITYVLQNTEKNGTKIRGHACFCRDKNDCNVARTNKISIVCIVFAFGLKMF